MTTTTILGVKYQGRPMMGSKAHRIWQTEHNMGFAAADRHLRSVNAIRKACGYEPLNLQDDMTAIPMEGVQTFGRKRA